MKKPDEFQWDSLQYTKTARLQESYGVQLLSKIPLQKNSVVLDAGCGAGNLTRKVAERIPNGYVVGIDLSDSMIQRCIADAERLGIPNVRFYVCGLNDLSCENEFDIIYSNSVLHWVRDVTDACKRIHTALRSGGRIGLQFPLLNINHPLVSLANDTILQLDLQKYYADWEFPWFVPKVEEFESMLRAAGFSDIALTQEKTSFEFDSCDTAYSFFKSVGLALYCDLLPSGKRTEFENVFYKNILEKSGPKALFSFQRLFAYARR